MAHSCRTLFLCGIALAVCSAPTFATSLIDEDFGSASPGPVNQSMTPGTKTSDVDAWWQTGGGFMSWQYASDAVMTDSGMAPPTEGNSLYYFVAKPGSGWDQNGLALSFDYTSQQADIASYSVIGWTGDEDIPAINPGVNGTVLLSGDGSQQLTYANVTDSYLGDLSSFEYIGVAFTQVGPASPDSAATQIDNVQLDTIPEPATMAIFGAGAGLLAWKRKRRRT
jgi:hypothetical protein